MGTTLAAEGFVTVADVRAADCPCITDETTDEQIQAWIDQASDILAIITGMRVAGRFDLVARPCRTGIRGCCDCCHLDSIPLGDPKPQIDMVVIDGDVLDSDEYDLHWTLNGWNLVRIGDGVNRPPDWPSYQERWKAETEQGTFAIHMTVGAHIQLPVVQEAVLELICDMAASAANPIEGTLPDGTIAAQIGGISIQVDPDLLSRLKQGLLGPKVNYLLGLLAPSGRQTPAVWAPELTDGWDLNIRPSGNQQLAWEGANLVWGS